MEVEETCEDFDLVVNINSLSNVYFKYRNLQEEKFYSSKHFIQILPLLNANKTSLSIDT